MPDSIQDRLKRQPPYGDDPIPPKEETVEQEVEEEIEEKVEETPEEPKETKEVVKEVLEDVKKVKKEVEKTEKTKERTKEQFDKLKDNNKNLKEENDVLKRKSVLDSLVPEQPEAPTYPQSPVTNVVPAQQNFPTLTPQQIKDTFSGLVDDQGYVDTGLLIDTLKTLETKNKEAEKRAQQAEQRSANTDRKFEDFQRKETMKELHKKYPRLDPDNEEFDERLWEGTRNEVVSQLMAGKAEDVASAAAKWSDILYGKEEEMKKVDREKQTQAEEAKKNINALGVKQTSQREITDDEKASLIKQVQKGKLGALGELLKRTGN